MKLKTREVVFFLVVIVITGSILRLTILAKSPFPINDGGLFYRMILDLQQNNYHIPRFTTYNLDSIPFAYPPLPFYLVGLLNTWLKIDLMFLFRFVPFLFNLIAIPFVYLFSKELVEGDEVIALIATAFWTFLPPSFEWLIMGGGITRSIAFTFSILSCYYFIKYLNSRRFRYLLFGIAAGGITGLSHLEIFWVMFITIVLIWLFFTKSRKNIFPLLVFYAGCMILLIPYIYTVISQHGISPFLAGFATGKFSLSKPIKDLVLFFVTDELKTSIVAVLSLLGVYYLAVRRQYFFVSWFLVLVILDPRSVNRSVVLPLSIIATIFLLEIFDKLFTANDHEVKSKRKFIFLTATNVIGIMLISQVFILSYERSTIYTPTFDSISSSEMESMNWINDNFPANSNFVILTQASNWELDNYNEWFPALTNQKSITTVQGSEWFGKGGHDRAILIYNGFKSCLYEDISCLQDTLKFINTQIDYVIVNHDKCDPEKIFCLKQYSELLGSYQDFKQIYKAQDVSIFINLNKGK